jgi:hypothetical protein
MRESALLIALAFVVGLAGCSSEPAAPIIPEVPDAGGATVDAEVDAPKQGFNGACTDNAQCETGICFRGGKRSFCTMPCTPQTVTKDCPTPLTPGLCNNQGFCKPPE